MALIDCYACREQVLLRKKVEELQVNLQKQVSFMYVLFVLLSVYNV